MTMFDPKTGKVLDREALKSVTWNPAGRTKPQKRVAPDGTKRTEVLHSSDGSTAGIQTEHPSGRVDAQAFPKSPTSGGTVNK